MQSVTLKAPAKVNLFLKVLGKRKDGYHDICTIFEKISLADKVTISPAPGGIKVRSDRAITRNPEDNIAYKAAGLVIKEFRISSGVSVYIEKKIPLAAGLGGGSSDAASVLMGMDRLFGLHMGKKRMAGLAAKLGADVPFFILGSAFAIGRGAGERLEPLNIGRKLWHLLVFPGFGSATKRVYEAFDRLNFEGSKCLIPRPGSGSSTELLSNPSAGSGFDPEFIEGSKYLTHRAGDVRIQSSISGSTDIGSLEAMLYNDLQCAASCEKKVLGSMIRRLTASLGKKVVLSGSGSSAFCLYPTRKEARKAEARIHRSIPAEARKRWSIFVAQTANFKEPAWRSPT